MSAALAELLVTLAEPEEAERFMEEPERVMEQAGLNDVDKMALRSGKPGWINYQARHNIVDLNHYLKGGPLATGEALAVVEVVEVVEVAEVVA